MLTPDEKAKFKELFSKYCQQEISKGHCESDCCEFCPITLAYEEIFEKFCDDEDEED